MNADLQIEVLRPADLTSGHANLWASFRAARPELSSPYFDLRYTLAAGEVAPEARVAMIRKEGVVVGFLPFQRRGGLIQPLGAPLTDYHGLIAPTGAGIDLAAVLRAIGAGRFQFGGLAGFDGPLPPRALRRQAMVADLSQGYHAYVEARRKAGQGGFLKDKRRRDGALRRDHDVRFEFRRADPAGIEAVVAMKRRQLKASGQHDIFACGWTEDLLHRLAAEDAPDFGLRLAALYADDRMIAAELGLRSGQAYHLWFPVYDAQFARYSPGSLMTLATLEAVAEQGVVSVDFGPGGEAYKQAFADPGHEVVEGVLTAGAPAALAETFNPAAAGGRRLSRRLDRIAACEPRLPGQLWATSKYLGVIARRRPGLTAGLGLGLGLGLALGLAAE